MLDLPEEMWGVRPCCNPACTQLGGPCELTVKTLACGGGCGVRYCCWACQEQAWRGGHRRNCGAMREMRERHQLLDHSEHQKAAARRPMRRRRGREAREALV